MNVEQLVDKYFWKNEIDDKIEPGMFDFYDVTGYIKKCVRNRENLGSHKFLAKTKESNEYLLKHFTKLIRDLSGEDEVEILKAINRRLKFVLYGIFGEGILENIFDKSDKYDLLEIDRQQDFNEFVDVKVRQKSTQKILYFQVKTYSYYSNPSKYQAWKMEKEKSVHEDREIPVVYAFYNHDFNDRFFVLEHEKVDIYGYGNSNIQSIENISDRLISKFGKQEHLTAEEIIF